MKKIVLIVTLFLFLFISYWLSSKCLIRIYSSHTSPKEILSLVPQNAGPAKNIQTFGPIKKVQYECVALATFYNSNTVERYSSYGYLLNFSFKQIFVYFDPKSGINPYLRWQEFWLQDECLDKGGQWTPSGCLFKEKQYQ